MSDDGLTPAKRRLLEILKRAGSATAANMAAMLDLTGTAVRQHLSSLEAQGLVTQEKQAAAGRGRPSSEWRLSEGAEGLFPDRHGELTVGLIGALREAFGEEGVERVIDTRARQQMSDYRERMPGARASLKSRVEALASLRSDEGYMAEVRTERPGSYLLVEHHCPICEAARSCTGLCRAELEVFQHALGEEAEISRTAHLMSGDTRCVYQIRKR